MSSRFRLLHVSLAFALASAASVAWIDLPLARAIHAHGRDLGPYWLATTAAFDAVTGMDLWKYFAGAVFVLAGIVASASPNLRVHAGALWFVAATHLASRVSTSPWKSAFARLRPYQWFEKGQPAEVFFAGGGSLPSGHVIYYLSLCLPLALAYRRWRAVFLAVPVLIACTRIFAEQHFLGDTLAAAAWVTLVAFAVKEAMRLRDFEAYRP